LRQKSQQPTVDATNPQDAERTGYETSVPAPANKDGMFPDAQPNRVYLTQSNSMML